MKRKKLSARERMEVAPAICTKDQAEEWYGHQRYGGMANWYIQTEEGIKTPMRGSRGALYYNHSKSYGGNHPNGFAEEVARRYARRFLYPCLDTWSDEGFRNIRQRVDARFVCTHSYEPFPAGYAFLPDGKLAPVFCMSYEQRMALQELIEQLSKQRRLQQKLQCVG